MLFFLLVIVGQLMGVIALVARLYSALAISRWRGEGTAPQAPTSGGTHHPACAAAGASSVICYH